MRQGAVKSWPRSPAGRRPRGSRRSGPTSRTVARSNTGTWSRGGRNSRRTGALSVAWRCTSLRLRTAGVRRDCGSGTGAAASLGADPRATDPLPAAGVHTRSARTARPGRHRGHRTTGGGGLGRRSLLARRPHGPPPGSVVGCAGGSTHTYREGLESALRRPALDFGRRRWSGSAPLGAARPCAAQYSLLWMRHGRRSPTERRLASRRRQRPDRPEQGLEPSVLALA